jgi:hypothetical protein
LGISCFFWVLEYTIQPLSQGLRGLSPLFKSLKENGESKENGAVL